MKKFEYMSKPYKTVGEGVLELCNIVESFAQCFQEETIYVGEDYLQHKIDELNDEIIEREKRLKSFVLDNLKPYFDDLNAWQLEEEYRPYSNYWGNFSYKNYEFKTPDTDACFSYKTHTGLYMEIKKADDNFIFSVYPRYNYNRPADDDDLGIVGEMDNRTFRNGSTLKRDLQNVGYEFHSENVA